MPISDKPAAKKWLPWQPMNLLDAQECITGSPLVSQPETEEIDATRQSDLLVLQKNAEQAGFAQGERQGFEQGKRAGYEEGLRLGMEEARAAEAEQLRLGRERVMQEISLLLKNMQQALDSLDYIIPSRLSQLALSMVRTLVGEQVLSDALHQSLQEHVRRLLAEEGLFTSGTQMWVSPEDEPLIRALFSQTLAERGWTLQADSKMLAGGCRLSSDRGEIDQSLETRWATLCGLVRGEHCL